MTSRIAFAIFIAGFVVGNWVVSLLGFLIYEFSSPIPLLAFLSSKPRN